MSKRELLVVRHAKAEQGGARDEMRQLTGKGEADCDRVAEWLAKKELVPDEVIASPAVRAAGTARLVVKALGLDADVVRTDDRLYLAPVPRLLEVLSESAGQRVMLVAHNPGLEDLVVHLAEEAPEVPEDGKLFPTAAVAWFRMPGSWKRLVRGCADLRHVLRPKDLR